MQVISAFRQRAKYVIGDYVSSTVAWIAYTCLRYLMNEDLMLTQGYHSLCEFISTPTVMAGMVVFPVAMMCVYLLSGYYNSVFRKSRVQELFVTIGSVCFNSLLIFFVALINDMANDRAYNYEMILLLLLLLFMSVYSVRVAITCRTSRKIKSREWQFNTLIVGTDSEARKLGSDLNTMRESIGNRVVGYVSVSDDDAICADDTYRLADIEQVCQKLDVSELIVAMNKSDSKKALDIINQLFKVNLPIKITPSMADIVLTKVRIEQFVGAPLVDISGSDMSDFSQNMKRFYDLIFSALFLIILSPFFLIMALLIKLDSRGPVVYRQRRVGLHNKPFTIYKFRSMVCDAESDGMPMLSSDNDARVTKIGRWMRKYRIDETLQFWNVVKGDMSLVGPRPEREYYLRQMMERVPYCALLHKVRPGITSLGMVKYGYAKNVDEMIERLKYDLLYLENMSIINDLKIMIYTVKIVINGRGI